MKNGLPSHDTIRRVMGMVSPQILQQLYSKWQERLNRNEGELIGKIQIKNQVTTIDAMGTQKEIAEQIKKKRADYVLALKGNQGTLYADVKEYFGDKEFLKQMQEKGCYKKTRDNNGVFIEKVDKKQYNSNIYLNYLGYNIQNCTFG